MGFTRTRCARSANAKHCLSMWMTSPPSCSYSASFFVPQQSPWSTIHSAGGSARSPLSSPTASCLCLMCSRPHYRPQARSKSRFRAHRPSICWSWRCVWVCQLAAGTAFSSRARPLLPSESCAHMWMQRGCSLAWARSYWCSACNASASRSSFQRCWQERPTSEISFQVFSAHRYSYLMRRDSWDGH